MKRTPEEIQYDIDELEQHLYNVKCYYQSLDAQLHLIKYVKDNENKTLQELLDNCPEDLNTIYEYETPTWCCTVRKNTTEIIKDIVKKGPLKMLETYKSLGEKINEYTLKIKKKMVLQAKREIEIDFGNFYKRRKTSYKKITS